MFRSLLLLLLSGVLAWLVIAYLILPVAWRRYEKRHPALDDAPRIAHTTTGIPGDPINVGLVATEEQIHKGMLAAEWYPADPITLKSSIRIAGSTVLHRSYDDAPVSSLYLWGHKQDLAFEQPVGNDARRRHHVRFWHAFRQSSGSGHLYQGRFKSLPVEDDNHFITMARYVERNALQANLAPRAELWHWCSLYRCLRGSADDRKLLAAWPAPRLAGWVDHVNAPQTDAELAALRLCVNRGSPFATQAWSERTIRSRNLESANPPPRTPKKQKTGS